jgi:hypothetical protein
MFLHTYGDMTDTSSVDFLRRLKLASPIKISKILWHLYTDRIDVDFNGIEYASYRNGTEQIAIASVPEPGSLALLSAGVVGLAWQRKRRGKRA